MEVPLGISEEGRDAGAEPSGRDAFGMEHDHAASPVAAAAVSPESSWDFCEFGVIREFCEIDK